MEKKAYKTLKVKPSTWKWLFTVKTETEETVDEIINRLRKIEKQSKKSVETDQKHGGVLDGKITD